MQSSFGPSSTAEMGSSSGMRAVFLGCAREVHVIASSHVAFKMQGGGGSEFMATGLKESSIGGPGVDGSVVLGSGIWTLCYVPEFTTIYARV